MMPLAPTATTRASPHPPRARPLRRPHLRRPLRMRTKRRERGPRARGRTPWMSRPWTAQLKRRMTGIHNTQRPYLRISLEIHLNKYFHQRDVSKILSCHCCWLHFLFLLPLRENMAAAVSKTEVKAGERETLLSMNKLQKQ